MTSRPKTAALADALQAPPMLPRRLDEGDEVRLLGRVAQGDRVAFESLYHLYHPRVTRFLDRMTRRPSLVGEVLNDTLLVVWHRAASFNGSSKVSTWIFAIAYRKALKALSRVDEPVEDEAIDMAAEAGHGPEAQLQQAQLRRLLAKALDGLSAQHRAVIELAYFHGAACAEIAEIVDCPVDTVKTRMFHARKRLKSALAGRLEDWL